MSQKLFETYLFGLSHKVASVELRDKVSFGPTEFESALNYLKSELHFPEALIVSTCNRTEIYCTEQAGLELNERFQRFFNTLKPEVSKEELDLFYLKKGPDAIEHLFSVISGIDSMILGEPQIQGQVKDAHRVAYNAGSTGIFLNKLFNNAVVVGKRARTETALGKGAVSVAYAAVELAEKIYKNLDDKRVLLIGSGDTGSLVAKHLLDKGVKQLTITNRTLEKAQNLAKELNGGVMEFSAFTKALPLFDLVIGATGSPDFVITYDDLKDIRRIRNARPLILIDIAVPRDFDPKINKLENVFAHNIDDLQNIVNRNLETRKKEIPRVQKIIAEEVKNYFNWKSSLRITPTITALREKLDGIRRSEIEKQANKLSDTEKEKLEMLTRSILNKILHEPMVHLREFTNGNTDGYLKVDAVRELFGLKDEEQEND